MDRTDNQHSVLAAKYRKRGSRSPGAVAGAGVSYRTMPDFPPLFDVIGSQMTVICKNCEDTVGHFWG